MPTQVEDRIANSVDPDQTAPSGTVWSWSTRYVQKLRDHYGVVQARSVSREIRNYNSCCLDFLIGAWLSFFTHHTSGVPEGKSVKLP